MLLVTLNCEDTDFPGSVVNVTKVGDMVRSMPFGALYPSGTVILTDGVGEAAYAGEPTKKVRRNKKSPKNNK